MAQPATATRTRTAKAAPAKAAPATEPAAPATRTKAVRGGHILTVPMTLVKVTKNFAVYEAEDKSLLPYAKYVPLEHVPDPVPETFVDTLTFPI